MRRSLRRFRRTTERYQWEKDRVMLPEEERRAMGAAERDTGLAVDDLEFRAEYVPCEADEDLAGAFGISVGTRLLKRVYRTELRTEGVPLAIGSSWVIYEMVEANPDLLDVTNEPWPGGTQHQLSTIGIELDRIVDEVTSRSPSAEEARELGVEMGVPVIALRKISIDTDDRVVEVTDTIMAGDRTELSYTTKLRRWGRE